MTNELGHLFSVACRSIKEQGVAATFKQGPGYLIRYIGVHLAWRKVEQEDTFDLEHGTDTTAIVRTEDFLSTSENLRHAVYYRATPSRTFERIIGSLKIKHEEFVFIDFGSGKGRILLQASEFPFKKIIGVEFEPRLHLIAQKNIQIFHSKNHKCSNIELVCTDATRYCLPNENSVLYFFDPFNLPVMSAVVENIRQSVQSHPRKIFVVYLNPNHSGALSRAGFLTRIYDSSTEAPQNSPEQRLSIPWHIYTNRF